ncbi:hypothetical protein JRQ81_016409 [Phrynocephalus forsythii]|uniref:Myb/SANT-like DNA-binding domain-containing protein n=1 Tax=Phrynocephalus forsythii TaxID=171643 RepID=A0A9Q0XS62_9SAUR|nr:hypothetical protein JRQ81_016409 [Phrynocephalus forsythii]
MAVPRYWSAHEISLLLTILQRNNFGLVLFVVGARRNEHAFTHASEELALSGYRRTSAQCQNKFKGLRQAFTKVLMDFSPDPPRRNQSPYWDEMKDLWVQSNQPDPAHLFPPGAGPGRNIALRPLARIRFQAGQQEENPAGDNLPQDFGDGENAEHALHRCSHQRTTVLVSLALHYKSTKPERVLSSRAAALALCFLSLSIASLLAGSNVAS